jgi:glycosyltransferase involved in cell wall biosynthesis
MRVKKKRRIRLALVHRPGRVTTGAHQINEVLYKALKKIGVIVKLFFPRERKEAKPSRLIIDRRERSARYIQSKVKFYASLKYKKREIVKCDVLQGVTYTGIGYVGSPMPVVASFGSTLRGYLKNVPKVTKLYRPKNGIYRRLENSGLLYLKELRPRLALKLLADIEKKVAANSSRVVACSAGVAQELIQMGVSANKINIIYNALSPEWLLVPTVRKTKREPDLVFIGRLGGDRFELALKGFDRLIGVFESLPDLNKRIFIASDNKNLPRLLNQAMPKVDCRTNIRPDKLMNKLGSIFGDILLLTSRYEGFSLSLIQGMSRGAIPICFRCGIAPEIINHGSNGYLINSPAEALRIIRTLRSQPRLRSKLAGNAMRTARTFTPERMAMEHLRLYQELKH